MLVATFAAGSLAALLVPVSDPALWSAGSLVVSAGLWRRIMPVWILAGSGSLAVMLTSFDQPVVLVLSAIGMVSAFLPETVFWIRDRSPTDGVSGVETA